MSAVNVLAVMDNARAKLAQLAFDFARMTDRHGDGPACRNRANELDEARAAVAELVDAAQNALNKAWEYGEDEPHFARLNAALAPFKEQP